MNIVYHAVCGIILDVIFDTKGLMTIFSILPDVPMWFNEMKLLYNGTEFDPLDVNDYIFWIYMFNHSLLMTGLIYLLFGEIAFLAYLIHIVTDWFTHTGRFASMPFFPFNSYKIKFGKDVLK